MSSTSRRKSKKAKLPRCVLLDTRRMAELDQLTSALQDMLGNVRTLGEVILEIGNFVRAVSPILSDLAVKKAKRSEAASKANETRRQAGADGEQAAQDIGSQF